MRVIEPSAEIVSNADYDEALKIIEQCGRVCYKSEDKISDGSAAKFVSNILMRGHEAVLEHYNITVKFVCDRGVSHEIVRHRIASYCQESSRYCNYSNEKFSNEITVIKPIFFEEGTNKYKYWYMACQVAEDTYFNLLKEGATAQEARDVLPNSLKTEVMMTANIREWRHFLKLRTSPAAHPQMRQVAIELLHKLSNTMPIFFLEIEDELLRCGS